MALIVLAGLVSALQLRHPEERKPTQFVVDCGLIHCDWPAPEDPAKSGPP